MQTFETAGQFFFFAVLFLQLLLYACSAVCKAKIQYVNILYFSEQSKLLRVYTQKGTQAFLGSHKKNVLPNKEKWSNLAALFCLWRSSNRKTKNLQSDIKQYIFKQQVVVILLQNS